MAKRCDCHAVVEMLERDPRLRALPLAPRMLWFALVRVMQSLSVSVLRFGTVVPDPREIALMVGVAQSELEANLEPILARGLLVREADGALGSPFLGAVQARSEVNRLNGLKGGARRREQAEARRRAQPELILPFPGGADPHRETESEGEAKPPPPPDTAKLKLEPASEAKPAAPVAVDEAEFRRVGQAALEAAGFDPARSLADYGIVRQWLADGASGELILEVIRAKKRQGIKHLGYFRDAIREATAKAPAVDLTARSMAFDAAVAEWRMGGKRGPMPHPGWFAADGSRVLGAA